MVEVGEFDNFDEVTRKVIDQFKTIEAELYAYGESVKTKDRWLVLNKMDLLLEEDAQKLLDTVCAQLDWQQPKYIISAATNTNLKPLVQDIMHYLQRDEHEEVN
jgi:GTP-binding protein